MRGNNVVVGKKGEELACEYLCKNKYSIIEVNYRSRYAEIDLVAMDGDVLVFVEVRTRTQSSALDERTTDPEESLNKRKLNKLVRNATAYAAIHKYSCLLRIDAICIVLSPSGQTKRLTHYKNIAA